MLIGRRSFIGLAGMTSCCGLLGFPGLTLAALPTQKRLLTVILRGGMDGLGAVVPVGDPNYPDLRRALMPDPALLLPIDNGFALHGALKEMHAMYLRKELVVLQAAASPYRERSHFDAQDLLENGGTAPHGLSTGWLGRTLSAFTSDPGGLVLGPQVPLVMQGQVKVQSYTPSRLPSVSDDFLERVAFMYQTDIGLSAALQSMRGMPDMAEDGMTRGRGGDRQFVDLMATAAKFMSAPEGARIAAIDLGGWDTHANQGTERGRLATALQFLDAGMDAFRKGMGDAWRETAVLVVTEFGRTVAINGTNGTDHGTATAAFLAGGGVRGGKVIGDWPGLAAKNLYQQRDLYPANDLRSLLKGVLSVHLGIDDHVLNRSIFPDSLAAKGYSGLF